MRHQKASQLSEWLGVQVRVGVTSDCENPFEDFPDGWKEGWYWKVSLSCAQKQIETRPKCWCPLRWAAASRTLKSRKHRTLRQCHNNVRKTTIRKKKKEITQPPESNNTTWPMRQDFSQQQHVPWTTKKKHRWCDCSCKRALLFDISVLWQVDPEQVVMSHSPLKMFYQFLDKHVLVCGQGKTMEIAKHLGYTNVTSIETLRHCFPRLDQVDHKRRMSAVRCLLSCDKFPVKSLIRCRIPCDTKNFVSWNDLYSHFMLPSSSFTDRRVNLFLFLAAVCVRELFSQNWR